MAISKSKKIKPLTNKEDIAKWIEWAFKTRCYIIEEDLTVNFFSSLYLQVAVEQLPIQIGKVEGHFSCNECSLKSFKGFPRIIEGFLEARGNQLTSFDYFPERVDGSIDLYENQLTKVYNLPKILNDGLNLNSNKITSLDGFPEIINGTLRIMSNQLTNLKGTLKKVNGQLYCDNNQIITLEDMPEVTGDFSVKENHLTSLKGLSQSIKGFLGLSQNQLVSLDYLPSKLEGLHATNNYLTHAEQLNMIKVEKMIALNKNKIKSIKNLDLSCENFEISDNPLENLVAPNLKVNTFKAYGVDSVNSTPSLPTMKDKLGLSKLKNFKILKNITAENIFIDDLVSFEESLEDIIEIFESVKEDKELELIIYNAKMSFLKKKMIFCANQNNFKDQPLIKAFLEKKRLIDSINQSQEILPSLNNNLKNKKQKI